MLLNTLGPDASGLGGWMTMRALSRIPFAPREQRVISGLGKWMGRLGRFQIVASVFVFVVLLAVTGVITTVEVIEPATATGEQPLVSIGEVSRGAIAAVVAVVIVISLVFLRGGMLLISASDDLESVATTDELVQHHMEGALRRLRSYFILESLLMIGIVAAAYAGTILGWGGI